MEGKPIFIKNIQEAEAILGMELSEIEKMERDSFLGYCWARALTILLISRERYQRPFTGSLK